MSGDFSGAFASLDALRGRIIQGAIAGLDIGASVLQVAARSSSAYNDDTGATRAGTVAFVAGGGAESGSIFGEAVAAVVDRNPAHVQVNSIGDGGLDEEVVVVLTIPTDYAEFLEVEHAGAHAVLGPTMDAHAVQLTSAAARGIERMLQ